jgi:hypothetical protein
MTTSQIIEVCLATLFLVPYLVIPLGLFVLLRRRLPYFAIGILAGVCVFGYWLIAWITGFMWLSEIASGFSLASIAAAAIPIGLLDVTILQGHLEAAGSWSYIFFPYLLLLAVYVFPGYLAGMALDGLGWLRDNLTETTR